MSTRKGVLIITNPDEPSISRVTNHLEALGCEYFRIDVDTILDEGSEIAMQLNGVAFTAKLNLPNGRTVSESQIGSIWFRRPKRVRTYGLYSTLEESDFAEAEMTAALWSLYTNLDQAFWMNHPDTARNLLEQNKLYQMKCAARCGLRVPETLVSNSADEVIAFSERHRGVVAGKVIQKGFLQGSGPSMLGIYTQRLTREELITHRDNIKSAPLMVQEYITKNIEIRTTIVGSHVLSCAIASQMSDKTKHDWRRYDFDSVEHYAFQLPIRVQDQLLAFMELCNLSFGAIDLILTPENEFVFLEVNPSGQFGWIESLAGLPISRTIAEVLADPPASRHRPHSGQNLLETSVP